MSKYKYEEFKDFTDLYKWLSERKPICFKGQHTYTANPDGSYSITITRECLDYYNKAIEIREVEITLYTYIYQNIKTEQVVSTQSTCVYGFDPEYRFIKTEKIKVMVEVTGE